MKKKHKNVGNPSMMGRPGMFYYMGGMVFEADNDGRLRKRPELGPKSKFTHKYFKVPKKV